MNNSDYWSNYIATLTQASYCQLKVVRETKPYTVINNGVS